MADREAGDLFIELGLDITQLESDFIAADRTIQQNLNRLNREGNLIRLRSEVEIGNLDAAADAAQILEIRQRALNEQMQIQRDRIRLTEAAFQDLTNSRGADAAETQRMEARLEHERLALQRLQQQLNQLNNSQDESAGSVESLQDGFQNLVNEALGKIPPAAKVAAASITGIATALLAAGSATKELVERWRELQTNAYNLNMPLADAEQFLRQLRFADTEVDDIMGYIRGITDAYTKGEWDDPEFLTLARYDTKIVDEKGRLLRFDEITERVYQAYQKAKAEGNAIEFLQLTGGESGVTDAIRFFERYEEAKEDANAIFDAGLDNEQMHEADRTLMRLTVQVEEFADAVADIITPASVKGMQALFDVFHEGTKFVVENRKALQSFAENALTALANQARMTINPLGTLYDKISDIYKKLTEEPKKVSVSMGDFKRTDEAELAKQKAEDAEGKNPLSQYGIQRTKQFRDELEDLRIEIDYFDQDYKQAVAKTEIWRRRELIDKLDVSDEEREVIEKLYAAKRQKIELDRQKDIDDTRDDIEEEFRSDFENQLAEFEKDYEDWLNAGWELEDAEKLYLRRVDKAFEDHEDALQEIRDNVFADDKTELQRIIDAIDKEKDSWIDDLNMDEAEAEELAQRKKIDAMTALEEDFTAAVDALHNTALQNRLAQIDKEKQAWIDKGIAEVKATEWAEQSKADAQREAAMSVLKSQLEEFRTFQQGGLQGLREYQLKELEKAGITRADLQMTPEGLLKFQQAQQAVQQSLLPNFRTNQEIADLNRQFDFDRNRRTLADIENQIQALGVTPTQNLTDYGRNLLEQREILIKQIQNSEPQILEAGWSDIRSGNVAELIIPAAEEVSDNFSRMSTRLAEVTGLLGNFGQSLSAPQQATFQSAPPNITVTVQIDEAHAWDSQHIQELADKVADKITPEIVGALGGDSNGY